MSLPFNSLDSSDFLSVIDDMNGPPNSHPCTIPNLNDFVSSNFPNLTNFRVDPNDPLMIPTNNCLYSTDLDFVNNVHNYGSKLTLIHFNIRSLSKHFEQLKDILHSLCEFSLIALSETWLKNTSPDMFSLPGYSLITNNRSGKRGGGVALYIHSDIHYDVREDLCHSTDSLESLFIEIKIPAAKNIVAGVMYKPPQAPHTDFMLLFQGIIAKLASDNNRCLLTGDFNINILNYNTCSATQNFLDAIFFSFLYSSY